MRDDYPGSDFDYIRYTPLDYGGSGPFLICIFYPIDSPLEVSAASRADNYEPLTYDIQIAFNIHRPIYDYLEKIFAVFNRQAEVPEDWHEYWGRTFEDTLDSDEGIRSMSVGDVVIIERGGEGRAYVCAPNGWRIMGEGEFNTTATTERNQS